MKIKRIALNLFALVFVMLGVLASFKAVLAHEIYVLPEEQIEQALREHSPSPLMSLADKDNLSDFMTWCEIFLVGLLILFFLPWYKILPKIFHYNLEVSRKYSFVVLRVFLGISLIFSGINKGLFGPEISLSILGSATVFSWALIIAGVLITLGIWTRWVATALAGLYVYVLFKHGTYLFSYVEYFFAFLIFGAPAPLLQKYAPALMRIGFGLALLWTAITVKFLHANLSLNVISMFHLDRVMHFEPLFIVLGAALIELMIAIFYILGLQLRFISLLFAFFATAAMIIMGEAIWPHIILYGFAIAIFMYGYDRYALQKKLLHKIA